MSKIQTTSVNDAYRVGWGRTFMKRCPVCLGKIPYEGGRIPVEICECGNCKCDGCVEDRRREREGFPTAEKPSGGVIHPPGEQG